MFKNVKKLFLVAILALVSVLAFACGEECPECPECPEINNETCKDFCETCNNASEDTCKDFCETCPEINEDTCKDFINTCGPEANKENCKGYCDTCPEINEESCEEFFPYVAPTAFILLEDFVVVGETVAILAEEFEPVADNVYTGLIWTSSDESIATVDSEGVVTGIKPGTVTITATSILDSEVSESCEVTVNDNLEPYEALQREKAAIIAGVPVFAAASFEFPKPWNENIAMEITDESNNVVTGFTYPEGLEKETKVTYNVTLTYGTQAPETFSVSFWAVLDAQDNSVVRLNSALAAVETIIKDANNGVLVEEDMLLPTYVYGATFSWDSALPSIIDDEGVYTRQNDDTPVKFDLVVKCGDNSASKTYTFTAKGYNQEEKLAYILEEGSLANIAGKTVSTSIVLPEYDGKFNAGLSYVSSKPEIMDNTGKLVAAPTEATDVEFTVNVDYSFVKTHKFTAETKFTVTVAPANAAAVAADAWLQESGFAKLVNFPYGTEAGNVLDVPVEYTKGEEKYAVKWDVSKALVAPKYLADDEEADVKEIPAFELTEEGKPELVVQYLRYQEVQIQGTFSDGTNEAVVNLVLNIGASEGAQYVYSGTWTTGDQKDTSLNPVTGLYDLTGNASHFDKSVGYASRALGYGYWSGVKITAPATAEGDIYEAFIMDYMYYEVADDGKGGVVKRDLALFNNGGDMGGNWGWMMKNTTDHSIFVEVGTYAATGQTFADGTDVVTVGSRLSYAMDGYAIGFVADKDGNVLIGSGNGKLQNDIDPTKQVKIGSDTVEAKNFVGDSASGTVYVVEVPAGGYAMSWKYQFYSQTVAAQYPFCQKGSKLEITEYGVHPLNSYKATTATSNLEAAEKAIAEGGIAKNASIEANLIGARNIYNNDLGEVTKNAVFAAERLEAAEKAAGALIDAEIEALLANEKDADGNVVTDFPTKLGALYNRFDKYTAELLAQVSKKADFDAKYEEYAAIDLYISYDYNGGYAQGFIYEDQKAILMPMFLRDLYDHLVAVGAFQTKVENQGTADAANYVLVEDATLETPTFEQFSNIDYLSSNFVGTWNTTSILPYYLFTPMFSSEASITLSGSFEHTDYRDVIEGAKTFFNTEKGQYWLPLADWVNEATQYANGSGQDFWGRKDLPYAPYDYLEKQTYFTSAMKKDPSTVVTTNSGTQLGAFRFAQYMTDSSLHANFKMYVPNMVYSSIFDRQTTQEVYGTQVYHCTDATVTLFDAPYKAGAEFAGWVFEDGSEAVVTGSMFKDVTVYAKWNPVLEAKIEEVVAEDLTPVYLSDSSPWKANSEPGSLNDQVKAAGLGKYAVVVAGKLFIMPKFALIELDGSKEYNTADNLKVYGNGNSDQASTGITYDAATDTATGLNSYGHGALYQNVSENEITIANVELAYGRSTVSGPAYGYNKYQFVLQEDGSYIAKLIGHQGEAKLAKGDFLWCPMTADRFCSGLTDCDGTNGVKGVLSDGCALDVVEITEEMLPVEKEWHTVKFVNAFDPENPVLVSASYVELDQPVVKPADLNREGYNFLGWAKAEDATEGEEVVEYTTEDITYYAVWQKLDMYDETSVNPATDGTKDTEFATIADALAKTNPNGTITVGAGTYADALVIEKPVTILGPNKDAKGYATRAEEAKFEGTMLINADNVVIKGLAFTGHDPKVTATIATAEKPGTVVVPTGKGFLFENNYVTSGKAVVFQFGTNEDVVFKNNFFDWTKENGATGAWAWRPIRLDEKVTNFAFEGNKVIQTADDDTNAGLYDIVYIQSAAGEINVNNNSFVGYSYNWNVNVANAKEVTVLNYNGNFVDGVVTDGVNSGNTTINVGSMGNETVANFVGNVVNTAGTTYSYDVADLAAFVGKINVVGNKFYSETYKPRIKKAVAAELVAHKDNYVKAGVITSAGADMFAFTMDGNLTDEAAFDAMGYEAAKEFTVNKFAAGYVNGTHVYLASKYQFNTYYDAEVALKYDVASDAYVVISNEQNCSLAVGSYDLLLAVHGSCANAEAAAIVKSLKAGDKVVIDAEYKDLTAYAASADVEIKVTVYPVVVVEEPVTIQEFADEIVAVFNATGMSDAKETVQNDFTGTTHPNVKYVFGNADNLTKYKWFLEYVLAAYTAHNEAAGYTDETTMSSGTIGQMKTMLNSMINGDTAAISGSSYADARTCFRQFIHLLINAENASAGAGNTAYTPFCVNYAENAEELAKFLELYKANK